MGDTSKPWEDYTGATTTETMPWEDYAPIPQKSGKSLLNYLKPKEDSNFSPEMMSGDLDKMKSDYLTKRINKDPNDADAYYKLGVVKQQQGDKLAATDVFFKGLQADPKNPKLNYAVGYSLLESGDPKSADEYFTKVIQGQNDEVKQLAYHSLAISQMRQGNADAALQVINQGIESNPKDEMGYAQKAMILNQQGDKGGAEQAVQTMKDVASLNQMGQPKSIGSPGTPEYENAKRLENISNSLDDLVSGKAAFGDAQHPASYAERAVATMINPFGIVGYGAKKGIEGGIEKIKEGGLEGVVGVATALVNPLTATAIAFDKRQREASLKTLNGMVQTGFAAGTVVSPELAAFTVGSSLSPDAVNHVLMQPASAIGITDILTDVGVTKEGSDTKKELDELLNTVGALALMHGLNTGVKEVSSIGEKIIKDKTISQEQAPAVRGILAIHTPAEVKTAVDITQATKDLSQDKKQEVIPLMVEHETLAKQEVPQEMQEKKQEKLAAIQEQIVAVVKKKEPKTKVGTLNANVREIVKSEPNDKENITGVRSDLGEGETPVENKPDESTSPQTPSPGGVVQGAPEEITAEHIDNMSPEDVAAFEREYKAPSKEELNKIEYPNEEAKTETKAEGLLKTAEPAIPEATKEGVTIKTEPNETGNVRQEAEGRPKTEANQGIGENENPPSIEEGTVGGDKPPQAVESEEPKETGIKNAVTKAEREAQGKDEVEVKARRTFGETFEKGKQLVESGKIDPRILAKQLSEAPRPLSPEESVALIYDRMRLQNEHKTVMNAIEHSMEGGDEQTTAEAKVRLAHLEDLININDEAARRTGYEQGLGLAIRRLMIKQDYSMANLIQRAKVAGDGKEVPRETRENLEKLSKQLDEANKKAQDYEDKIAKMEAEKALEKTKSEVVREQRTQKRAVTKTTIRAEREELLSELKKIAKKQASTLSANPIPAEMIPILAKLTKNYVLDGVVTLEGIVDNIYHDLKDDLTGITKRDVRDAISGYGKVAEMSKDEINVKLREIKQEGRLISALEDAEKGQAPLKSGLQRDAPTEKAIALRKEITKMMRDKGVQVDLRTPEEKWRTMLEEYKERLKNRKVQLESQIEEAKKGNLPEPKKKTTLDTEAMILKSEVNKVKRKLDNEIKQVQLKNRTTGEKFRDYLVKWQRFAILSGVKTLGKLTAAAAARQFVVGPTEEVIGGLWGKLPGLSKIAEKAPREGGFSPSAEAKNLRQAFEKATYKDIYSNIKEGRGILDELFGKKDLPPEALNFFGHLHSALKVMPKRGEFFRSFEKRTQWAIKNGYDISDPLVQMEISASAYEDANRAIFMNENRVVSAYQGFLKTLENKNAKGESAGNIATAARLLLPIVKVPSNYFAETVHYIPGLGAIKSAFILAKGIKNLTPEQSDYVMRTMKKQSVGAAMVLIGFYNADNIGGYYQPGKKDKDQPDWGDVKIMGTTIPHWVLHNPALEMLQFGASMRHVWDKKVKGQKKGAVAGTERAVAGVLEQQPFVGEAIRAADAAGQEGGLQKFGEDMAKSFIEPRLLQEAAEFIDTKDGEPVKRKPANFVENLETGIPGLREQVKKKPKK